ncbi:MAG: YhjD/YihY/BrkB family envelope integrity protein [Actinomycetaceae bacterium]|nr:YhjD/YihY/BrkB family envelope integrity protein [Actinomycetaceae bacterium]
MNTPKNPHSPPSLNDPSSSTSTLTKSTDTAQVLPGRHISAPGGFFFRLLDYWGNSRLGRAFARYAQADSEVRASGIAVMTLLALASALTAGMSALVIFIGANSELRIAVEKGIEDAIPNLLRTASSPHGFIDSDSLIRSNIVSTTGLIALALAIWTTIGVVGAFGRSIRAIFALPHTTGNIAKDLGRSALGGICIALSFILGAGLTLSTDILGTQLFRATNIQGPAAQMAIVFASYAIQLLVLAATTWVLVRMVGGAKVPRRDLLIGITVCAIASLLLRMSGTALLGQARHPALVAAAGIITLILWLNLQVRILLICSAWMANPPRPLPPHMQVPHSDETPNYVTVSASHTLKWPRDPLTGVILSDSYIDDSGLAAPHGPDITPEVKEDKTADLTDSSAEK